MNDVKTLAQRLRDKESRDNRALLDEAADAIAQERIAEALACGEGVKS